MDRIEGDIAVCELDDGSMTDIELSSLPEGTREGSVLVSIDGVSYSIDKDAENAARERLFKMQESLFDE
ncbi:MAG: DUF3006 domain-containing protein [Clostridiales bacterium]|nr:DUF3006 domain-containing protein [Clostridiales bacterium]